MATILCVDDDRAGLATLARTVRAVAPVVTAASVPEARGALARGIAVVVTDHRMPGASGTALLADVRARDDTIGRILVTAYVDVEGLMDAINRGHVHRYVVKPWDPRELRAVVAQALAASTAERERRRLAAENAAAYARLRALDAARTRLVTLAAHELRTPLHVLGGVLEALAADTATPAAAELIAIARRNLTWLGRTVGAMADLVRLARPHARPHVPLCLAALARAAAAEAAPLCARRRLAFTCDLPATAPLRGHAPDLHLAVMNLLLNAIRFTPDGGHVALRLRTGAAGHVLAVADDGIGIPAAFRASIGEPFVAAGSLDRHHSDPIAFQSGGIGLGLAVARAIAREHGGRLWFASEEGRGTTFHLELPTAPGGTVTAMRPDTEGSGPSVPTSVLGALAAGVHCRHCGCAVSETVHGRDSFEVGGFALVTGPTEEASVRRSGSEEVVLAYRRLVRPVLLVTCARCFRDPGHRAQHRTWDYRDDD